MAHVAVSALSKQQHDELACTYAALLLHDGDLEISEEKLKKVLAASNNNVEGYWPGLFAKALKGRDVGAMLSGAGSAAPVAAPAPAAAAKGGDDKGKKDTKKKEEKPGKSRLKSLLRICRLPAVWVVPFRTFAPPRSLISYCVCVAEPEEDLDGAFDMFG